MNYIRSFLLFLLVFFSIGIFAIENDSLNDDSLKIGVTNTAYPPYWMGSVSLPQGLAHDIGQLIAVQLNVNVEYVAYPTIEDVQNAILSGEIDLAIGYLKTPERERNFLFTEPLYKESVVGWVSDSVKDLNAPKDLRWACLKGMSPCSILQQHSFSNIVEVDDYASFYEYMRNGEVDALIGFYSSFLNYFSSHHIEGQKIYFDHIFGDYEAHAILSKRNIVLRNNIDRLLSKVNDEQPIDEFKGLYNNYYYPKDVYSKWYQIDKSERIIKYTVDTDLFPYSYVSNVGELKGYVHDVIRRIELVTPLEFEFIPNEGKDIQKMLANGEVDFVPLAKRENYNPEIMSVNKNSIDIKYVLLKSLRNKTENKFALLDRFNYTTQQDAPPGFEVFDDASKLLSALRNGDITHAYVNKFLVESILKAETEVPFIVSSKMGRYNFNTKACMLVRKSDAHLKEVIEEAFLLLTPSELDSMWMRYNQVEYSYGYEKKTVNSLLIALLFTLMALFIAIYFTVLRMREQVDGAQKKSELSEVHRRWLVDIIENIPNYVCIRDESGTVELSNRNFRKLCRHIGSGDENKLLDFILNNAHVELRKDHSKHLKVIESSHPLSGKYFHVVDNQVTHYLDDVKLYMTVLTDITELKEKENKLIKANEEAEASIQQKTNFLAVISHELRTPISGILGLMEMLEHRTSDELDKQILNNASASTSKLKLLVDDILDFSKLDAKQLSINIDKHNLALELSPILKSFEALASRKGIGFYLDWVPSAYIISNVDFLRFSQIASNVLSNAIKFTDSGSVVVKIRVDNNQLFLDVKDSGIGMDELELQNIFDPFVQAQDSIARKYGGTGLGMSIVKNLVGLMQGKINVVSAKSIGTCVQIELPIKSEPYHCAHNPRELLSTSVLMTRWLCAFNAPLESIVQVEPSNEVSVNTYPEDAYLMLSQHQQERRNHIFSDKLPRLQGQILVVEDDPVNRFLVKLQLDRLGVDAVIVNQGDEALALISGGAHHFDLLLTDCHMPGMNGFELTRILRSLAAPLSKLPVVAFTADNSAIVTTRAASVGIKHILYKPYELVDLYRILNALLPNTHGNEQCVAMRPKLDEVLLSNFSDEDKALMAHAIIDSFGSAVEQLQSGSMEIGDITHRLKGAAGALSIQYVVDLCEQLSENPSDHNVKASLIQCLIDILHESNAYLEQRVQK